MWGTATPTHSPTKQQSRRLVWQFKSRAEVCNKVRGQGVLGGIQGGCGQEVARLARWGGGDRMGVGEWVVGSGRLGSASPSNTPDAALVACGTLHTPGTSPVRRVWGPRPWPPSLHRASPPHLLGPGSPGNGAKGSGFPLAAAVCVAFRGPQRTVSLQLHGPMGLGLRCGEGEARDVKNSRMPQEKGGYPPPPPPLPMFEADSQHFASAPSVPSQVSASNYLARLRRGPQGDPGRRGGPSQTPLAPPPPSDPRSPPSNTSLGEAEL